MSAEEYRFIISLQGDAGDTDDHKPITKYSYQAASR